MRGLTWRTSCEREHIRNRCVPVSLPASDSLDALTALPLSFLGLYERKRSSLMDYYTTYASFSYTTLSGEDSPVIAKPRTCTFYAIMAHGPED